MCNGSDDWPCGAKPNAPTDFTVLGVGFTLSDGNVELQDQQRHLLVVQPGQQFNVSFDYQVTVLCGTNQHCDLEIEVGTDAGKQGCGDSLQVTGSQQGPLQVGSGGGNAELDLTLPNPGVYKILTQPAHASSCGGNTWTGFGTPDDHLTVGIVCVHP